MRSRRPPRITGAIEWIASGVLLIVLGAVFLAFAFADGTGIGSDARRWLIALLGIPVGLVMLVVGLVKRRRQRRVARRGAAG